MLRGDSFKLESDIDGSWIGAQLSERGKTIRSVWTQYNEALRTNEKIQQTLSNVQRLGLGNNPSPTLPLVPHPSSSTDTTNNDGKDSQQQHQKLFGYDFGYDRRILSFSSQYRQANTRDELELDETRQRRAILVSYSSDVVAQLQDQLWVIKTGSIAPVETAARALIEKEYADFIGFASVHEPQWRVVAGHTGTRRELLEQATRELRGTIGAEEAEAFSAILGHEGMERYRVDEMRRQRLEREQQEEILKRDRLPPPPSLFDPSPAFRSSVVNSGGGGEGGNLSFGYPAAPTIPGPIYTVSGGRDAAAAAEVTSSRFSNARECHLSNLDLCDAATAALLIDNPKTVERLVLDGNDLASLLELPDLPNLRSLSVRDNKLSSKEELVAVLRVKCPRLKRLSAGGNIFCPPKNDMAAMDASMSFFMKNLKLDGFDLTSNKSAAAATDINSASNRQQSVPAPVSGSIAATTTTASATRQQHQQYPQQHHQPPQPQYSYGSSQPATAPPAPSSAIGHPQHQHQHQHHQQPQPQYNSYAYAQPQQHHQQQHHSFQQPQYPQQQQQPQYQHQHQYQQFQQYQQQFQQPQQPPHGSSTAAGATTTTTTSAPPARRNRFSLKGMFSSSSSSNNNTSQPQQQQQQQQQQQHQQQQHQQQQPQGGMMVPPNHSAVQPQYGYPGASAGTQPQRHQDANRYTQW